MEERFKPCKAKNLNAESAKEDSTTDSDEIFADDLGSLYVSNETFFKLANSAMERLKKLSE